MSNLTSTFPCTPASHPLDTYWNPSNNSCPLIIMPSSIVHSLVRGLMINNYYYLFKMISDSVAGPRLCMYFTYLTSLDPPSQQLQKANSITTSHFLHIEKPKFTEMQPHLKSHSAIPTVRLQGPCLSLLYSFDFSHDYYELGTCQAPKASMVRKKT